MNYRAMLYKLGRKKITFREWENYFNQILEGDPRFSNNCLIKQLDYCCQHIPFYKSFDNIEFSNYPIINKALIKQEFSNLLSDELHKFDHFRNSSGGSTGKPLTFIQDKCFTQWSIATQTFYYQQFLGVDYPSVSKVVLWGSERDLLKKRKTIKARFSNWLTQTNFLNTFKVSEATLLEYIQVINTRKPVFIKGYAGSLYILARLAQRRRISIHNPKFVYSSAETLRPFMRNTIEEVFGCKVYDFYGSREVGSIAGECFAGKLHVFDFNTYVEIVDASGHSVRPGEEGRVITTTLHNRSMPLIRYEIGDTACLGSSCSCGSPLPVLERVTGRLTDHFSTSDGSKVHGEYFTHLFYFLDWLEEFQILQTDIDQILVFYVSALSAPEVDISDIDEKIRYVMGKDCNIEWKRVETIPRTPQGKLLYTRNLLLQENQVE